MNISCLDLQGDLTQEGVNDGHHGYHARLVSHIEMFSTALDEYLSKDITDYTLY